MGISITHLLDSLGWALLHSLWQGGLAFIVVVLIRACLKNNAPSFRYVAQLSVLIACFAAFLTTFGLYFKTGLQTGGESFGLQAAGTAPLPLADLAAPISQSLSNGITAVQSSLAIDAASLTPLIGIFWCLGFAFMALRYAGAFLLTQRLRRYGLSTPNVQWRNRFRTLVLNAGLSDDIRLHISKYVNGPVTLGFIKPVVLVPVGFLVGLPQDQIEAILLHEIAHIRRYDYVFNLVQTAIKTVFFFHPAIHYISRRIDIDREQACDDLAVAQSRNPQALAKGLATLRLQSSANGLALSAIGEGTQSPLLDRLARLAGYSVNSRRSEHMFMSAVTAMLIGSLYVGAAASANAHPEPPETPSVTSNIVTPFVHPKTALKNYTFKSARINGRDVVLKISQDGRRWVNADGVWYDVDKNPSVVNRIPAGMPTMPKMPKLNNVNWSDNMSEKAFEKLISKDAKVLNQFQIDMEYYERRLENYAKNHAVNERLIERLEDKADRLSDRFEDKVEQRQDRLEDLLDRRFEYEEERREAAHERGEDARELAQEADEGAVERKHKIHQEHSQLHGKLYEQLLEDALISPNGGKIIMKFVNEAWTVNGTAVPINSEKKYCRILADMGVRKAAQTQIEVSPNSTYIFSQSSDRKSRQSHIITHGEFNHKHYGNKRHQPIAPAPPASPVTPAAPATPTAPVAPFIVPTKSHKVNVKFGMTDPVWSREHTHAHKGIDLGAKTGTPVYASRDGEVSFVAKEAGWGNRVIVKHTDGYQTLYAHLDNFIVEPGQKVSAGQIIGAVGSTGNSPGPHLHFEIRKDGKPIDPSPLIF